MAHTLFVPLMLTLGAGLATGIGSTIALFAHRTNKRLLSFSLGLSGGVMIYVSFVELFQQAREAIRRDGCEVIGMVAAYTYGFPVAEQAFKDAKVPLVTLTNYEAVLDVALRTGYIEEEDIATLNEWRKDPAHWETGK